MSNYSFEMSEPISSKLPFLTFSQLRSRYLNFMNTKFIVFSTSHFKSTTSEGFLSNQMGYYYWKGYLNAARFLQLFKC